ncbi:ferritin-like domain-containing protein [Clostridium sp. SHJSY1]|uniref:ferritin-like domain-containing protein n=1 Tax=Clostridium sp. SHJSY1 TaxID=2942483 RepID=UPI00287B64B3|nr:ferritin-like domain-containing protein [Clostridium sp. SHJSY1]
MKETLEGIMKGVQGEREDELFYDYLISQAPTNDEKQIISSIRDDERRHNMLFRRMYKDFTGMEIPQGEEEKFQSPESYLEGIKRALFGELSAVERYRAIRRRLPREIYRDMLFDIITDELKHASKYNYLFTLNSMNNNTSMSGNMTGGPQMQGMTPGTSMSGDMTSGPQMQGMIPGTSMGGNMTGGPQMQGMTPGTSMSGNMIGGTQTQGTTPGSSMKRNVIREDTSEYTPDDWVKYITPLVSLAMEETKEGINNEHLYQKYIILGVLVGTGMTPKEAIDQVEEWKKTGSSKLLRLSRMSRYFDY